MTSLQWQSAALALHGHHTLVIPELCLTPQDCWAFVGSNGSGKTALASALCGELAVRAGGVTGRVRTERLSFESQQRLGELDWQRLWKRFFKALTIEERRNEKAQMNHVQKRFWKDMVEMQGDLPSPLE